ncbi:uncharacterized protein LOC135372099 [Ornithodoros turicata]|uniref:uncharacterized protein LOC135372099 n=1 Tax=Ornithodoros turicata TaxID=34597 RepID=UPI0031388CED
MSATSGSRIPQLSREHMEALVSYMETNRQLANPADDLKGNPQGGSRDAEWRMLAEVLNRGQQYQRTAAQWRTTWLDKRRAIKRKYNEWKASCTRTGNRTFEDAVGEFSDIDARVLQLLGAGRVDHFSSNWLLSSGLGPRTSPRNQQSGGEGGVEGDAAGNAGNDNSSSGASD